MESQKNKKIIFSFGKNWLDYARNFVDEDKIKKAEESLLKYLPKEEYQDKLFIDVGCGSGIFSLAALHLGAKKVISFDIDQLSVEAAKLVKEKFSHLIPKNSEWEIFKGDILDIIEKFKNQGDIVYCWGVVHHTGQMYQAIKNVLQLIKPKGYLILAVYNRASSSDFWLKTKKFYNLAPMIIKKLMAYSLFSYFVSLRSLSFLKRKTLKQPVEPLFSRERGMSIFYDVIDWLGGYPYEYASFEEIKNFVEKLGFELIKAPTKLSSLPKKFLNRFSFQYTGNNEFVFKKNETK